MFDLCLRLLHGNCMALAIVSALSQSLGLNQIFVIMRWHPPCACEVLAERRDNSRMPAKGQPLSL